MAGWEKTQFANVGKVLKSPWKFSQRGQSGLWVSDLFPHIAAEADQLCVIKSMTSKFPEHTSANYFLHTGTGLQGRPSIGSWATYGLGSENQNVPGFVLLNGDLIPSGGMDNSQQWISACHLPGLGVSIQGPATGEYSCDGTIATHAGTENIAHSRPG